MSRTSGDSDTRDTRESRNAANVDPRPTGRMDMLLKANKMGKGKKRARTKGRKPNPTPEEIKSARDAGVDLKKSRGKFGIIRHSGTRPRKGVLPPELSISRPEEFDEGVQPDIHEFSTQSEAAGVVPADEEDIDDSEGEESPEEMEPKETASDTSDITPFIDPVAAVKGIPALLDHSEAASWDGNQYATYGETSRKDNSIDSRVILELPVPLRAKYLDDKSRLHTNSDIPLRDYLVSRLDRCQSHVDEKAIYLGDRVRREIEKIAHRNFDSAEELLGWIMVAFTSQSGSLNLHIEPELVNRVSARKDPDQTLDDAVTEYAEFGIMVKTGML